VNSNPLLGERHFNEAVSDLQQIPYILFVEIGFIFIPLLYHALYGLFITWEMRPNNLKYPYARNWFYTVQRVTGIILFFFILFHLLNFRFGLIPGLNETSVAHRPDLAYRIVSDEFQTPWILAIYFVGIVSTIWHFANGIWLFAVDWGIVIGERAQRLTGYACIGFGVLLLALWLNVTAAFVWRNGGLLEGIL
jgi:succinate dehydrogenase / fumarate reductase cytochrome b subunit